MTTAARSVWSFMGPASASRGSKSMLTLQGGKVRKMVGPIRPGTVPANVRLPSLPIQRPSLHRKPILARDDGLRPLPSQEALHRRGVMRVAERSERGVFFESAVRFPWLPRNRQGLLLRWSWAVSTERFRPVHPGPCHPGPSFESVDRQVTDSAPGMRTISSKRARALASS